MAAGEGGMHIDHQICKGGGKEGGRGVGTVTLPAAAARGGPRCGKARRDVPPVCGSS